MGGFVKVAREHADVELVGTESPLWPRTGTGSGWITTEAYEHLILLVEPEQPFLGTVRLEALPYQNVDISQFYPYGDVSFP